MIPEFAIREWNEVVPWTESEQVEQDLLICRALTEIYKDEYLASHLAFRGGTALHKLYLSPQPQRRKGRDLYDLYKALTTKELNIDNALKCYHQYMDFVVDHIPTYKEFIINMEDKMQDEEFLGDTQQLLRPDEKFNPQEAYALVRSLLIDGLR
nr:nucleotidyl transferase AbiEii/AbiGii toxin family protein [Bacteroidales bacterium]